MTTWILVADRAHARLFQIMPTHGDGGFDEVVDFPNPEGRMSVAELGGQGLPSGHDRMGPGRHAIEPHTLLVDKVSQRFAAELAQVLQRGRIENRFDALILIAPPRFRGQLKRELDPQVIRRIVAEVDKDLSDSSIDVIRRALPRHAGPVARAG